jgi:hypothetical protein
VSGAVAIVFGLVPGLFSALTLGVRNFRDALLSGAPAPPRPLSEAETHRRPLGLAVIGGLIAAFTLAAYLFY